MHRFRFALIAVVIAIARPAPAEFPVAKTEPSPFDTVLQRAAAAAASVDWTEDGWADEKLESSLADLLGQLSEITKKEIDVVTIDSVQPATGRNGSKIAYLDRGLFVTKRGKVSHAKDSIIIADESIKVSHAHDCLIMARGVVDVSHGGRNVIIAGRIHTSHDGHPNPRQPGLPQGSVLLSGSVVDIAHAYDTVVCAPVATTISHATNVTFINSVKRRIAHEQGSKYITKESSALPALLPKQD